MLPFRRMLGKDILFDSRQLNVKTGSEENIGGIAATIEDISQKIIGKCVGRGSRLSKPVRIL